MSSRTLNRKQFLTLTATSAAVASFLQACGGDDPVTPPGSAGTGTTAGTGTGGTGTAGNTTGGTGTAGTGTAGTGTAGTGTAGTASGGMSGSGTGGSGGASGGSGGASGGSGGASGGSGGASGGSGGGGGGMCGTANIVHTGFDVGMPQHTHVPQDAAALKMSLKDLINGNMSTMAFTLPNENNHDHKITLTAQQVATLKGGGMVTGVKSTTDGNHNHIYTISCVA